MPTEQPLTTERSDAYTEDPLIGFRFKLELEGTVAGYFTEVSGVGSEHEIIEHPVVDDGGRDVIMKQPGRMKWQDITLKRGITSSLEIWEWRDSVGKGKLEDFRKNVSLAMMSPDNSQEIAIWEFLKAWPSKVSGPTLKADANEIAIEEITIVHEGMVRKK